MHIIQIQIHERLLLQQVTLFHLLGAISQTTPKLYKRFGSDLLLNEFGKPEVEEDILIASVTVGNVADFNVEVDELK